MLICLLVFYSDQTAVVSHASTNRKFVACLVYKYDGETKPNNEKQKYNFKPVIQFIIFSVNIELDIQIHTKT